MGQSNSGQPVEHLSKEDLFSLLYDELRSAARRAIANEATGHSLTPTALVHEVYDRMRDTWASQQHFLLATSIAMRNVLVDWARGKLERKQAETARNSRAREDDFALTVEFTPSEMLSLDQALQRLRDSDVLEAERKWKVVHLRFLVGLNNTQIAAQLGISETIVERDWSYARAWLYDSMAST